MVFFAVMKTTEETASLCALNKIFGFEPKIATALIGHFGSASEVVNLSNKELSPIKSVKVADDLQSVEVVMADNTVKTVKF